MKPLDQNQPPVDDLDRLLLDRFSAPADSLTPSSGFTQSVMDAVREQASAPQPIPFPWKRFLPFAIAATCVLMAFILATFVFAPPHQSGLPVSGGAAISWFLQFCSSPAFTSLASVALAIGLSITTTLVSLRLAIGRS